MEVRRRGQQHDIVVAEEVVAEQQQQHVEDQSEHEDLHGVVALVLPQRAVAVVVLLLPDEDPLAVEDRLVQQLQVVVQRQ